MSINFEIKNFRSFTEEYPLRFDLNDDIVAFLGVNNAGKSSILRFFWELRPTFQTLMSPDSIFQLIRFSMRDGGIKRVSGENSFTEFNSHNMYIRVSFSNTSANETENPPLEFIEIELDRLSGNIVKVSIEPQPSKLGEIGDLRIRQNLLFLVGHQSTIDLTPIVETFSMLVKAMFVGPFRNTINVGGSQAYFDMAIGSDFTSELQRLKSGTNRYENVAVRKMELDIQKIFGFSDFQINSSGGQLNSSGGQLGLQVIVDGKSYRLAELGSGIAHFIMIMLNTLIKKPSILLIDEPELHLHPSLQLDFLTTLGNLCSNGVMFSTHSIGLARAGADRIYVVDRCHSKGPSQIMPFESAPDLPRLLGQLGFSEHSELGFRKILLVEGTTDVKIFQQLLRLYKLDHEIVILPLGGSSLIRDGVQIELEELKRITLDIAAVIDSEKESQESGLDHQRTCFVKLCEKLNIDCHVLERRATEHYFADHVIKEVKGNSYRALETFEKRENLSPMWPKSDGWKIARQMSREDIDRTDLGIFLGKL